MGYTGTIIHKGGRTMSKQSGIRNMTEGSPAGHLIAFSLPLLAGSFLQQFYNMVDSAVVGNFVGDSALAAVGIGWPVVFMFSSLFMGLSNGGTVVIAQFFGAGNPHRVRDAVDTIYTAFLYAAIPITLLAVGLVYPLMVVLRVDSAAWTDTFTYLIVVCAGIIGTIGYNLNAGILGGLGNSRTTLLFLSVATVMNIVLDLLFVAVFRWGVFGAALATIISQASSWLFGLFYINRHYPDFAIRPFCRRFDKKLFRQIMSIGLPAGLQMSLVAIGSMAVLSKINSYGQAYTAAYNAGSKIDSLVFLPIQSLSTAITAFVGQNIGAKRLDRARQGIRFTVVCALVWSVVCLAVIPIGPYLIALFSDTPEVMAIGGEYLACILPGYLVFSVMFSLNNAMRGAGDSMFALIDVVLSLILVRVPMVYIFANRFGPDYMFYGITIGWAVGCLLSVLYYFSGIWKRKGSLADK